LSVFTIRMRSPRPSHLHPTPLCLGPDSLRLFGPNIWRPPCSKPKDNPHDATKMSQLASPPRRRLATNLRPKPNPFSPSTHACPPHHRQNHRTPNLRQSPSNPVNMSTTTAGSSQNGGGTSSTQTNGGAPHQSPPRASLSLQVIQGNTEFDQIQV
jgi:hypothetical protein